MPPTSLPDRPPHSPHTSRRLLARLSEIAILCERYLAEAERLRGRDGLSVRRRELLRGVVESVHGVVLDAFDEHRVEPLVPLCAEPAELSRHQVVARVVDHGSRPGDVIWVFERGFVWSADGSVVRKAIVAVAVPRET
ncbi:MAG: hypothetical protein SFY96_01485 [Planctomycetota bacterium]|nr:hypothetical protein [Planctomycetota bacterium]